jgi:hypothetical protein
LTAPTIPDAATLDAIAESLKDAALSAKCAPMAQVNAFDLLKLVVAYRRLVDASRPSPARVSIRYRMAESDVDVWMHGDSLEETNEQITGLMQDIRAFNGWPNPPAAAPLLAPRWIPCSERMPETDKHTLMSQHVLVCSSIGGFVFIAKWSNGLAPAWWIGGSREPPCDFPHWMPLPAPPANGAKEGG